MNLACAGSAFGSLHGRGTSVSRVQSSCFFLRGSCRPGKCRQGYTARQRPRFCSQAWPCIHLQSPSFSRRAHTFRFETRSFRATERTIDPGRLCDDGACPQNEWLVEAQRQRNARSCSPDRLHKTRIYYKSGAEEGSSRTGMRRPAVAASASRTAWARETPKTVRGEAAAKRRSRCAWAPL